MTSNNHRMLALKAIGAPTSLITREIVYPNELYSKVYTKLSQYLSAVPSSLDGCASFIISGDYGTGKSQLALWIVENLYLRYYQSATWLDLDQLYELLQDSWKTEEAKKKRDHRIYNTKVLVIDNVPNTLSKSRDFKEVMPLILRKRTAVSAVTILTTPVAENRWEQLFGAELVSLFGEGFKKITLNHKFR